MSRNVGYIAPQRATNGLAIAGFVISLVGFVGCAPLAPVGLILSFIAVFREPRGLAIAGLVLGILGSVWVVLALLVVLGITVIGGGLLILVASTLGLDGLEAHIEMAMLDAKIAEYRRDNGSLPPALGSLPNPEPELLTDPWGRPYNYKLAPDGSSFQLSSDGADGTPGTPDDITHHAAAVTGR